MRLPTDVRTWLLAFAALLLVACVGPAPKAPAGPVPTGPFFYPPAPAAPRIQHLATLSSQRDLSPPRSGLAELVAGKDTKVLALRQPYGAALHAGKLYVADTGAPGLAVFDLGARRMSLVPGAGAGRMQRPINVTFDRDGTHYVSDTGIGRVLVFDRDDRLLRSLGGETPFRPVDLAIAGDRLYVVDIQHHQVQVLDKTSGSLLFKFGKAGVAPGELFQPTNIALGPDGDLYVVETGNFRVQRFKPDGTHVRFYGEVGNAPGAFARPKGVAVDREGRLYVADAAFQNVQVFDNGGQLLMDFGAPMPGLDGLSLPAGVQLDYDHVALFARYADPAFSVEHLILVVSQFGPNKVDVYGFGRMAGVDYSNPAASGKR
jgi:DNA-binding beta-propeller fold protein YncE